MVAEYQKAEKESVYKLSDEEEYIMDITFTHAEDIIDRNTVVSSLQLVDKTAQTIINCPEIITIGTNHDNRKYRLLPKSLDINKTDSFLNFKIGEFDRQKNELTNLLQEFSITLRISKGWVSTLIFGVMSTLIAAAIAFLSLILRRDNPSIIYMGICLILVFIASTILFWKYNKK